MGKKSSSKDKDKGKDKTGEQEVFLQENPMNKYKDSNSEYFGDILYELKEESASAGGLYKRKYRCCFYEKVVLIQDEEHFLCYPTSYSQEVFLKYKLAGVNIQKAKVPHWLFYLACVMLVASIPMMVEGDKEENKEADDDETRQQAELILYLGIVCFIFSLIIFVVPFLFINYFTTFTFAKVAREDNIATLCRDIMFGWCPSAKSEEEKGSFTINTTSQPDQDFLFSYVYGVMGPRMPQFHAYAHLANDGLSGRLDPKSLKDLDAMA